VPTKSQCLAAKLLISADKVVILQNEVRIDENYHSLGESASSDYIGAQRRDNDYIMSMA
jgi:hypothetical protein